MINYNLNSHLVLLAQFNQQNGRGSACSKCEKTRNSNKNVCVVANEQVMHTHTQVVELAVYFLPSIFWPCIR